MQSLVSYLERAGELLGDHGFKSSGAYLKLERAALHWLVKFWINSR